MISTTPMPVNTQPITGRVALPTQRQNSAASGSSSSAVVTRVVVCRASRSVAMALLTDGGVESSTSSRQSGGQPQAGADAQPEECQREGQVEQLDAVMGGPEEA